MSKIKNKLSLFCAIIALGITTRTSTPFINNVYATEQDGETQVTENQETSVVDEVVSPQDNTSTNHRHNVFCYKDSMHIHSSSCYGGEQSQERCDGHITWTLENEIDRKCGACGKSIYHINLYIGHCDKCNNDYYSYDYTDNEEDVPMHTCETIPNGVTFARPELPSMSWYPQYPSENDNSIVYSGELTCGMEQSSFYSSEQKKTPSMPICSTIVVDVQPKNPTQESAELDDTLIVTFLDGHTSEIKAAFTTFDKEKKYDKENILLYCYAIGDSRSPKQTNFTTIVNFTTKIEEKVEEEIITTEEPTEVPKQLEENLSMETKTLKYPIVGTIITMVVFLILGIIGKAFNRKNNI